MGRAAMLTCSRTPCAKQLASRSSASTSLSIEIGTKNRPPCNIMSERSDDADDSESARFLPQFTEPRDYPAPRQSPVPEGFDIHEFASTYGLTNHLGVLQKATLLANDPEHPENVRGITRNELAALHGETARKWRQPNILYFTIFVCSLGAILQGWSQTGINGANLYIPTALNIDPNPGSARYSSLAFINCAMYLSNGLVGTWLSEPFNDLLGRRGAIFLGTSLALIGNLGSALIPAREEAIDGLAAFRLVLGLGLGINAATFSIYAAECAPAYIRGGLAVFWQLFVAFGILLGFIANVVFYNFPHWLIWRLQLAGPILPAIPILCLIFYCPESPSLYIKRSQYDYAWPPLRRLRNTDLQAASEILGHRMKQEYIKKTMSSYEDTQSCIENILLLISVPRNLNALLASFAVMISQQLCGINVIAFYSSTIFASPGGSILAGLWASVIFGAVNFLGAFPAIWTMDTFGRRRLLLYTLPPMALTMAFASMSYSIPSGTNHVQFLIMAALIYVFCSLYSPGMGPVPCAYSAEVYPLKVREVGMSFAISTANLWATVLSLTVPELLRAIGGRGVFGLYSGFNVLAWILCWLFVRETKGVKLEDMDTVFEPSMLAFIIENWRAALEKLPGRPSEEYRRLDQRPEDRRRMP